MKHSDINTWFKIKHYRDFYDFPRVFIIGYQKFYLLFDCPFVSDIDEYSAEYKIYILPELSEQELLGSWDYLQEMISSYLGHVAVDKIKFDETNRQFVNIDEDWLNNLIINSDSFPK